jgi:exonuclease VII large subunit
MKGPLTLADELRAIRGGGVHGKALSKRPDPPAESERPWKSDLDRMEHTIQQALQVISQFSGVQLPEALAKSEGEEGSLSRVDSATLKDRIRNDLEAFSVTTVSEMAKQAEQRAKTALTTIQDEMTGQIEETLGQYRQMLREKMDPQALDVNVAQQSQERVAELVRAQTDEFARWVWLTCKGTGTPIPLQIEKLLEPYVEEATALVKGSMEQRVQELLQEQEKVVDERLKGKADSMQTQVATLQQAAQQMVEKNADSVIEASAERLNTAADRAADHFENRVREHMESSVQGAQTRLDETTADLLDRFHLQQDQMAQDFIRRLEALSTEMEATKGPEIVSRMEQAAGNAMETSLQKLKVVTDGAVEQIQETGRFVNDSVEEGFKRVGEMLGGEGQDLSGFREKLLKDSKEHISTMVDDAVGSIEPRILQMAEEKIDAASAKLVNLPDENLAEFESRLREASEGQYRDLLERIHKDTGEAGAQVVAEIRTTSETVMQELSEKVDAAASRLNHQQEESGARFESSVNDTLDGFRKQLAEITRSGMEEQRKTISTGLDVLQKRLRQAAEALVTDEPSAE